MYNEIDKNIYNNEIKPYLPIKIFDAHTHLCTHEFACDLDETIPIAKDPALGEIDIETLHLWWKTLFPNSKVKGLVFGFPTKKADLDLYNEYVFSQCENSSDLVSLLCSPEIENNTLEGWIKDYNPVGLKPYMCYAKVDRPELASICDIIPERQIELADKYNLAITIHVAKPRGMADEDNLSEIKYLVKRYPNCNFILAHCGRCFIAPNMEQALKKLPIARNLWIDTSAVCDIGVFLYLFSRYDINQILFGTDLVTATGFRGNYIRMGMNWDFIMAEDFQRPGGQQIKTTFAVYENLCALFCAANFCKLKELQINDIFYNNAKKLFKF